MRILITGAGGFLGKRLSKHLADGGHDVIAVVRSAPSGADLDYFASPRISTLPVDIADLDCRLLPKDVNAVYSLAQSSNFRNFPDKAGDIFAVNVTANMRLLQWAVANRIRKFVYASSGGIYGERRDALAHETDLLAVDSPLGFYLGSKLCTEILFQNYRHLFQTAVILRPFFIYGPGQKKDMLIARLVASVEDGRPIQLQGRNGLRLNPIYIDDAVLAFARALALDGSHVINIAGPDTLTLRDIGESIGTLVGKRPVFEVKEGTPVHYVATIDAAVSKLGLTLTGFAEGIRATIEAQQR